MIKAELVKQQMDRCGAIGIPFLFGIDFEMTNGFFIENPLQQKQIIFSIGNTGNFSLLQPETPCPTPNIHILDSDRNAYLEKFQKVHSGLQHGNSFLLNLTEKTPITTNLTLSQIFSTSRARYKLLLPEQLVCFSPECFVKIRQGEIFSYPMKGTIDASIPHAAELLLNNYKEECEHYTIVDLIRNDLNRVASKVRVNKFRYIEKIKTLGGEILQTSSEISGKLPDNYLSSLGEIIFNLLPAGSISGAPKISTLSLIRETEKIARGFYTGVFGYFDGQHLDSAVMIRYIEKEGDQYYFRSGGGITINSNAREEYQEVLEKIYLPIPSL